MRALVTGISGFVGGHLTEHLVAEGDLVVGLSASGRWPAELAHLGQQRTDRAIRPRPGERGEARRDRAPEAARGDLSSGGAIQSAGEPRRSAGHVGSQFLGKLQPARGGEAVGSEPAGRPCQLGGLLRQSAARVDPGHGKTVRCARTTLMPRARRPSIFWEYSIT